MIRTSFLLLLLLIATVNSYAQNPYVLNGWAKQDNCHCYTLTTETPLFQTSSIWNNNKIDLTKPFDYSFNVYLGCNDANGADGIAFALHTSTASLGVDGAGMGFQNITPSIGVTIDTYYNDFTDDPVYDHIAIQANGDAYHNSINNLAGPVQALAGNANIEDCKWHVLEVNWQPAAKLLNVSIDSVLRLSLTKDIIADIFNNDPMVYWGFTGSTGGEGNLQQMCTSLEAGFALAAYTNTCVGTPLTFVDSSVSFGSISNWYWDFGDGTTSTLQNPPPHAYASPGNYTASLNITDGNGCVSDTFKQDIAIAAYPVADFKVNAEPICANSDAVFTDATTISTGTVNYWYWDFGNGTTSNMQNPPPVDYAKGNYNVKLFVNTKENCAADTVIKNFAVNSVDIDFTKSNDTCKNIPIEFTAKNLNASVNINQWSWNFGDNSFSNDPTVTHTYTNGGNYTATLVAAGDNGCISDTIKKPITVYTTNANAGEDATIILGMPYQLNGSGGDIYRWSPATGLSNAYISNPIATLFNDITYMLTVSTIRGCATKDSVHLKVMKGPEFYVPTAFTPNGDGRNDRFKVVPVGISEISFFRIANRWGQVMYSSKNFSDGWDGNFNGLPQPAGTYIWMVAGKSIEGNSIKKQGTLVLIR